MPSRLFLYYNERDMEGTTAEDAGAVIRDGFKSLSKQGVCPETEWPYDIKRFADKPADACYADALNDEALAYLSLSENRYDLLGCLAEGFPFALGITLFESFESDDVAKTGMVPLPTHGENALGGHAVLAVGYDQSRQVYIVRNSWGAGWGDAGYFYLPFDYLHRLGLGSDFWTLRKVE
jgi:C1A family cysteine protease